MSVLKALRPLLKSLPSSAVSIVHNADAHTPRTLYQTLSRLPRDGVGARVFQTRWQSKGIEGCYYEVTRVKLKAEGSHGKAWGKLVWRGKPVSESEEQIRGGLKHKWSPGVSKGNRLRAISEPEVKGSTIAHANPVGKRKPTS